MMANTTGDYPISVRPGRELRDRERAACAELGYVAVAPDRRGKGLSRRLVSKLLNGPDESFFATTSSEPMKNTLCRCGFSKKGKEWTGQSGLLSLWIRPSAE